MALNEQSLDVIVKTMVNNGSGLEPTIQTNDCDALVP